MLMLDIHYCVHEGLQLVSYPTLTVSGWQLVSCTHFHHHIIENLSMSHIQNIIQNSNTRKAFFGKIVTACGIQKQATIPLVVSNWVVAVPLAVVLAFAAGVDYPGIWWGMLAGGTIHLAWYMLIVYRVDWDAISSAASMGASKDSVQEDVGFDYVALTEDDK